MGTNRREFSDYYGIPYRTIQDWEAGEFYQIEDCNKMIYIGSDLPDEYIRYATELTELAGGQKLVRLYDPSGNLIEVRTPFMSN